MTDENLNEVKVEETKECNCPVCRVLKSDCTKKFLGVILASFIGCSLALLVFAPKKCPCTKKMVPPPYERMMPMPPMHGDGHFYRHEGMRPDFKRGDFKRDEFKKGEFKREEFKKNHQFNRPQHNPKNHQGLNKPQNANPQPVIE